jgi:hypothetical protein
MLTADAISGSMYRKCELSPKYQYTNKSEKQWFNELCCAEEGLRLFSFYGGNYYL